METTNGQIEYCDIISHMEFDIYSSEIPSCKLLEKKNLKSILDSAPACDSKYKEIWKRARMKLKLKSYIKSYLKENLILSNQETTTCREGFIKILAKEKNSEALLNIDSMASLMIHPSSTFKSIWNVVISLLLLYTVTVMPLSMAFLETDSLDVWFYMDIALNVLFFLDILIIFNSAYIDSSGSLVSDRKIIAIQYLKSWFSIDFISCVPFGLITGINGSHINSLLRLARLPRLTKLLRFSRVLKLLRSSNQSNLMHKVGDMLDIKTSFIRLFQGIMTALILVHLMACLWYYSAKYQDFDTNTWVFKFGFIDMGTGSLYLRSLYFIVTTLATVGYGDIYPVNDIERIIVITWIVIVIFFMTFTISSVSTMISSIDTKESIIQYKTNIIDNFCTENKLSKELRFRLKEALRYSTESNGGSIFNKQDIVLELPKNLRIQVAQNMHKGCTKEIHFFQRHDQVFVSNIIPYLICQMFRKSDTVYSQNDHPDEVYFIVNGRVGYILFKFVFQQVFKNECFGFLEIFGTSQRIFTTKAMVNMEVLTLKKNILFDVLKKFPVIDKSIRDTVKLEREKSIKNMIEVRLVLKHKRNGNLNKLMDKNIADLIEKKFSKHQKIWMEESETKDIDLADLANTSEILRENVLKLTKQYKALRSEVKLLSGLLESKGSKE